ncbi:MAG: prenyltransferase [Thermoplasmata archaeon]|uniref:Prenyltransferase n=1 Tax=Candidatus Sysuiplasma superficiale TaxID=2823368 RepID=A0A8J8CAJ4_9ARCH|nr:prenyltransferase [Candidatus Sysuiplasma superficiale]MBX8644753.1 prenyltransferase [Candidatus Sysuiplasma superficiale]MCL5437166.1 prenyltransferase [Candidatus Thermoplasmatota archaeon]
MSRISTFIKGLRLPMYWASGGPVLLTASLALFRSAMLRPFLFLLGSAALLIFEVGVNIMAEIADSAEMVMITQEETWIPTGPFLVKYGGRTAERLAAYGAFTLAVAGLTGLYLAAVTGITVILLIGLSGLLLTYLYAFPPFELGLRGLGEPVAFFSFGPLPMFALYFLASGKLSILPVIISIPTALWVTAIRYAHHLPDTGMRRGQRYLRSHSLRVRYAGKVLTSLMAAAVFFTALLYFYVGIYVLLPAIAAGALSIFISGRIRRLPGDATSISRQTKYFLLLQFVSTVFLSVSLLIAHG